MSFNNFFTNNFFAIYQIGSIFVSVDRKSNFRFLEKE